MTQHTSRVESVHGSEEVASEEVRRENRAAQVRKKTSRRKSAAKRELIAPRGDKRYVRRDRRGRLAESDDQTRSLSTDRRRKAKRQ